MENSLEPAALDTALGALAGRPGALVAALAGDGLRVPCPDDDALAGMERIPVPPDRASLLDVVVSEDRWLMITTWDRAKERGVARATVRASAAPDVPLVLTFIDQRHRLGVWIGVFSPGADAGPEALDAGALQVVRRPRTARMTKNIYAVMTEVDDRALRMLGFPAEELLGRRSVEFLHPDDHERAIADWMELLSHQRVQRVRVRHLRADGSWLWVELENTFRVAEDVGDSMVVTELTDISEEMAGHDAVRQREALFRRLAESLPNGVLQVRPDRSIVYANARLARIFGSDTGATLDEQFRTVAEADRPVLEAAVTATLEGTGEAEVEVEVHASAGRVRCLVNLTPLAGQDGGGAIISVTDVTESSRLREELRARATFDELTGCHNRSATMAYLEGSLAGGKAAGLAALFIDLDGFKPVNDRYGHAAGDQVLTEVARRLRLLLRDGDIVGRLGGDEFLLLCPGVVTPEQALGVVARIEEVLDGEFTVDGGRVRLRASIGVAVGVPDQAVTADTLVARADAAMYQAKRDGAGTVFWAGPPAAERSVAAWTSTSAGGA